MRDGSELPPSTPFEGRVNRRRVIPGSRSRRHTQHIFRAPQRRGSAGEENGFRSGSHRAGPQAAGSRSFFGARSRNLREQIPGSRKTPEGSLRSVFVRKGTGGARARARPLKGRFAPGLTSLNGHGPDLFLAGWFPFRLASLNVPVAEIPKGAVFGPRIFSQVFGAAADEESALLVGD